MHPLCVGVDEKDSMKPIYENRIIKDPAICGGEPVIKGTRVRVKIILDNLTEGHNADGIVKSYPTLTVADVNAAIAFANQCGGWI